MFLTGYRRDLLARVMTTLAESHSEREIRVRVGELMLDLLGAQYYASYVWNHSEQRFDVGVHLNVDADTVTRYEQYYQFHDPITPQLQLHRRAVRVTDVMPQPQLRRTEFFSDLLARNGFCWGINLYAWYGDRNIGDMRIWRDQQRDNFTRDDMQMLDLVRPALVAALLRCGAGGSPAQRPEGGLGGELEGLLSKRQFEVATLAARGLADKDIARRLGISITTVRTHIDDAFRKLDINNRVCLVRKLGH